MFAPPIKVHKKWIDSHLDCESCFNCSCPVFKYIFNNFVYSLNGRIFLVWYIIWLSTYCISLTLGGNIQNFINCNKGNSYHSTLHSETPELGMRPFDLVFPILNMTSYFFQMDKIKLNPRAPIWCLLRLFLMIASNAFFKFNSWCFFVESNVIVESLVCFFFR